MQYCVGQSTQSYQDRSSQSHSELFRNGYNFVLFKCIQISIFFLYYF